MRNYYSYHNSSNDSYFQSNWTKGVKFLILANLVGFALQIIVKIIFNASYVTYYFGLHPRAVFEQFWLWQLVTCAFLHDVQNIFHLFFNMLTLFFFGSVVERYYGTRRFLIFYFLCAIFASLVFSTFEYFLSHGYGYAIGASGAIMGVMVITACVMPDALVYIYFLFPVRLSKLIWILVALDLYMVLVPHGGVAATGHLGGALFGYLYFRWSTPILQFFSRKFSNFQQSIREEYIKEHSEKYSKVRMKVDWLLEKIHREGITSLTDEERAFLQKASQSYREEFDE